MDPVSFWRLHPLEFHWIADAKRSSKRFGRLAEHQAESLYQKMKSRGEPTKAPASPAP